MNFILFARFRTIMFVRFYFLRLSHPHDRDLLVMHQDTPQALLNVAKSIKRKDVSGYLDAISSFPSSPQTDDVRFTAFLICFLSVVFYNSSN